MSKVRAGSALLLLAAVPVLLVGLLVALGAFAVFAFTHGAGAVGVKIVLYVGLGLLVGVVAAVRQVWRARPGPLGGMELGEAAHPEVWAEVRSLAAGLGTAAPARIVVDPAVNAAVTEVGGRREMLIGFPLLAAMTRGELRSVLAHELGHYGAGHTRLAALTYRGKDFVVALVAGTSGLAHWLVRGIAWAYLALAAASNREQEHEADQYSARVAGPLTAAAALRRIVDIDLGWEVLVDRYVGVLDTGVGRPPLAQGLRSVLDARRDQVRAATDQRLAERRTSALDTHPPLGERIARFEAQAARAPYLPPGDDRPAWTLLGRGTGPHDVDEEALDEVERAMLRSPGPRTDWDRAVARAGAALVAGNAGHLTRAALQTRSVQAPTLGAVLDAVAQGGGAHMVRPLVNPGVHVTARAQAEAQVLGTFLGSAVAHALVECGAARFAVSWSDDMTLTLTGGGPVDLDAVVGPVVRDPGNVPALREWLVRLGVDLSDGLRSAAEPDPEVQAAWAIARRDRRAVDVVVCDTGLLLVDPMVSGRGFQLSSTTRPRKEAEQLQELVRAGIPAARQRKGCTWIDTDDVVAARLRTGLQGLKLDLVLADGRRTRITTRDHTAALGDPAAAIGRLLGARLSREAWQSAAR